MGEEEISGDLKEKINKYVEQVFEKFLERASKGESVEGLIKALTVEKVMNILGALIKRTVAKKIAKKAVKKAVDRYWEKNREIILKKIECL